MLLPKRFATNGSLVFWLVLLMGIIARVFFFVSSGPSALNQDEAAILSNARFLAEVGKDEWGQSWPIAFRSFGDAKLPGYIYTVLVVGKLIGFSDVAVRLPSFMAGIALLWLIYKLAGSLTNSKDTALASVILLIFSPWSWHYGTLGFEANLGLALWVAGLWFLLRRRDPSVIVGAILLGLSILTYNAPLLLLPAAIITSILRGWGDWRRVFTKGGAIVLVGLIAGGVTVTATLQKGGISIFQDPTLINNYPAFRATFDTPILQTFFGNKLVYFATIFTKNWFSHFSWDFLVLRGGENPWHTMPMTGHFHFMLPLLLALGTGATTAFFFLALKKRDMSRFRLEVSLLFLFLWSLIPSSITTDAPHATRSLFFFLLATIVAARGLVFVQNKYCGSSLPKLIQDFLTCVIALTLAAGFVWWWMPTAARWKARADQHWNIGLPESLTDPRVDSAEKVYILDPNGVLYTVVLTEKMIPAVDFLSSVRRSEPDTAGLVRVERFGKYEFIFQQSDAHSPGLLLMPRSGVRWDIIEL